MAEIKSFTRTSDPELCRTADSLTVQVLDVALVKLIGATGLHPASATSGLLAGLLRLMDGMSEKGTDLMLKTLREDEPNFGEQKRALDMLLSGYERSIAKGEA